MVPARAWRLRGAGVKGVVDPALVPALYDALTVARLGSVGAAAKRLGKTPSAVSQQIRHLTEALGVPLFERRGRGLVLTPAAEQVLPAATRLFDEVEAVFRLFGELEGTPTTTLRIAASDYMAKPLLVPVLRELALEGAALHFEISTAHSEEAIERLDRGMVDMAIASFPGERPGLTSRALFEQPFFWVAPRERGKKRASIVSRLSGGEPILRLAHGSMGRKLLERFLDEHAVRPRSTIDVPSVSLLLAYATGGVGIGLVPALPLEPQALGAIALERAEVEPLPVKLLFREGRRPAPVVEKFMSMLEREAGQKRARLERLGAR